MRRYFDELLFTVSNIHSNNNNLKYVKNYLRHIWKCCFEGKIPQIHRVILEEGQKWIFVLKEIFCWSVYERWLFFMIGIGISSVSSRAFVLLNKFLKPWPDKPPQTGCVHSLSEHGKWTPQCKHGLFLIRLLPPQVVRVFLFVDLIRGTSQNSQSGDIVQVNIYYLPFREIAKIDKGFTFRC